jgi:hypothetical protein
MKPTASLSLALAISAGCKGPPEAPAELNDLCAYLFTHMDDEDPEALQLGVANLDAWVDAHFEETLEGYEINNLDQETVDGLYGAPQDLTALAGAAVGTESDHSVDDLAGALVLGDQTEVYPDTYEVFQRIFVTEGACFVNHSCEATEFTNHLTTNLPLGITITHDSTGQYRWVELDSGAAMINRSWLAAPAEINVDWLRINKQFSVSVTLPRPNGEIRMQAIWVQAEFLTGNVPENTALNMTISSLQKNDERLYEYLDGG